MPARPRPAAAAAAAERPRVFLLGWTGCQPRHLAKYAEMYAGLGFEAVCFTEHCSLRRVGEGRAAILPHRRNSVPSG